MVCLTLQVGNKWTHLEKVVGAADKLKRKAPRHLAHASTGRPEPLEDQVAVSVGELGSNHHTSACGEERVVVLNRTGNLGSREGGSVDSAGEQEARQDPVVCRVLENVEQRHGTVGEAVDEERLELAFGVVG